MKVRFLRRLWFYPKAVYFSLYSLTYNAFRSDSPLADIVFEPVFWIVDHFAGALGKVLVVLVVCLTSAVVLIFYVFVIPIVREYDVWFMVCHLLCGHWLLLNVTFHYYKACLTSPGHPPILGKKAATIQDIQVCTKCIQQKPLRTHHCSVCNKCVLKMDHHCPWVNNCIGHFNHRYFFSFCVYMCLGTIYVSVTTFPKFLEHLNVHAKNIFKDYFIPTSGREKYLLSDELINENKESIHNFVIFEFMLCSCVSVAVGGLALWHGILISRGETSIETYINKSRRQQMKKEGRKFVNPYHYGYRNNWKMALGLQNGRGIWTVLLPSSHPPWGNGIGWTQLPATASHIKQNNDAQGAFMA